MQGLYLENIFITLHKGQQQLIMCNKTMSLDNDFTNALIVDKACQHKKDCALLVYTNWHSVSFTPSCDFAINM